MLAMLLRKLRNQFPKREYGEKPEFNKTMDCFNSIKYIHAYTQMIQKFLVLPCCDNWDVRDDVLHC